MKTVFKILDYLSAVLMGTGTFVLATIIVSKNWNMVVAMIAGMVIGMGVLLLSLMLFVTVSTPFEILPKGMIITMVTGMISGMVTAVDGPDFMFMLSASVVFSLCAQAGFDLYNRKLQGNVPIDNERQ
jgi:hypothetical protein